MERKELLVSWCPPHTVYLVFAWLYSLCADNKSQKVQTGAELASSLVDLVVETSTLSTLTGVSRSFPTSSMRSLSSVHFSSSLPHPRLSFDTSAQCVPSCGSNSTLECLPFPVAFLALLSTWSSDSSHPFSHLMSPLLVSSSTNISFGFFLLSGHLDSLHKCPWPK